MQMERSMYNEYSHHSFEVKKKISKKIFSLQRNKNILMGDVINEIAKDFVKVFLDNDEMKKGNENEDLQKQSFNQKKHFKKEEIRKLKLNNNVITKPKIEKEMKNKSSMLSSETKILEERKTKLVEEVSDLEKKKKKIEKDICKLSDTQNFVNSLKQKIREYERKIKEYEINLKERDQEIVELRNEENLKKKEVTQFQKEIKKLEMNIFQLEEKNFNLEKEKNISILNNKKLSSKIKKLGSWKTKRKKVDKTVESLLKRLFEENVNILKNYQAKLHQECGTMFKDENQKEEEDFNSIIKKFLIFKKKREEELTQILESLKSEETKYKILSEKGIGKFKIQVKFEQTFKNEFQEVFDSMNIKEKKKYVTFANENFTKKFIENCNLASPSFKEDFKVIYSLLDSIRIVFSHDQVTKVRDSIKKNIDDLKSIDNDGDDDSQENIPFLLYSSIT